MTAEEGDSDQPVLGTCCICGGAAGVGNIVMLERKAAVPGHGWGCLVCGLAADGASAVLCDACLDLFRESGEPALVSVCRGYPALDGRCTMEELPPGRHAHHRAAHERLEPWR